jgi:hypothetical protein
MVQTETELIQAGNMSRPATSLHTTRAIFGETNITSNPDGTGGTPPTLTATSSTSAYEPPGHEDAVEPVTTALIIYQLSAEGVKVNVLSSTRFEPVHWAEPTKLHEIVDVPADTYK